MRARFHLSVIYVALSILTARAVDPVLPPNLALWLRADSGIEPAADSFIWRDQSGNGRHAVADSLQSAPTFLPGAINLQPTLKFDGIDDQLRIQQKAPLPIANGLAIFAVVRFDHLATPQILLAGPSLRLIAASEASLRLELGSGKESSALASAMVMTSCDQHVLTATLESATASLHFDGEPLAAGALTALPAENAGRMVIGASPSNHSHASAEIAELLIFAAALTPSEREAVHTYLGLKYFPLRISEPPRFIAILDPVPTFATVRVDAGPAVFQYQWQQWDGSAQTFVNIPGATLPSLHLGLPGLDWGLVRAHVFGPDGLILETQPVTVHTLGDIGSPAITLIQRFPADPNQIELRFNMPMDPPSASNVAHYNLSGGSTVTAARLIAPNTVLLFTTGLVEDSLYELTAVAARDPFGNAMPRVTLPLPPYRPALTKIGRTTDAFTLSWTTINRRFALESSSSLACPNWNPVARPIHLFGPTNIVAICAPAQNHFYRLREIREP